MTVDGQPPFLRRSDERVGSCPWPFRRGEDAGNLITAGYEGIEHGLAECLLADDHDPHFASSEFATNGVIGRVSCSIGRGQACRAAAVRFTRIAASRQKD